MARLSGTSESAIEVKNLAYIQKMLKNIGVPDAEIKAAGMEAAKLIAKKGKELAPKRTGNLARNIKPISILKGAYVRIGWNRVPYANPIHWGWFYDKNNFIEKNIKPNPFFSRALGYEREEIEATYTKNMNELLQKWGQPQK